MLIVMKPLTHTLPAALALMTAAATAPLATPAPAHAAASPERDAYVLYFRADWCSNCLVMDPAFEKAQTAFDGDDGVEFITLDLTDTPAGYNDVVNRIVETGLTPLNNAYLGITGFAAIVQPGSSEPVSCLARVHTKEAMIEAVKTVAAASRAGQTLPTGGDILCPPPQRRG